MRALKELHVHSSTQPRLQGNSSSIKIWAVRLLCNTVAPQNTIVSALICRGLKIGSRKILQPQGPDFYPRGADGAVVLNGRSPLYVTLRSRKLSIPLNVILRYIDLVAVFISSRLERFRSVVSHVTQNVPHFETRQESRCVEAWQLSPVSSHELLILLKNVETK